MKQQKIISLCGIVLLLCLSLFARAQTPPTPIPLMGPTTVCEGTKHTYSVTPTPGIYYSWRININGYISSTTANSALVYWGAKGIGILTVYGIDATGDTTELGITNVIILAKPEPVITTDNRVACQPLVPYPPGDIIPIPPPQFIDTGCIKVCENSTVTYTAGNGALSSTYTWTVDGGSASPSGNTCTVTWGAKGPGKVTVMETTTNGCEGTKSMCIDIIEAPIADFFAFPDSNSTTIQVCDKSEVVFVDRSFASAASPIVAWHWDFGDGTYSNAQGGRSMPISHIYNGPGSYTAILTVTNACGCKSSFSITINVDGQPALEIACPSVVCEGASVTYTVNTVCPGPNNWSVIGGTIAFQSGNTATIDWTPADPSGFGYVFFDGRGCPGVCPSVFVTKVPVVLNNGVIQGPDTICPDKEYIFKLPQWPTTKFNWSELSGNANLTPSDQPNELVVNVPNANAGNTITIQCDYNNTIYNCGAIVTKDVYVQPRPKLDGPDIVCLYANGVYILTGPNAASANWTLTYPNLTTITGSGSVFSPPFDQVGSYILSVEGDFCSPPNKEITVNNPPPAPDTIIGPDTICKGAPIKYEAGNEMPGTLFNWRVENGDANAASGNFSFVKLDINSAGPFVIHLWRESTTSPHCHSDTLTKIIDTPVLNFTVAGPDTVCPSSYQNYSVNYQIGETYEWFIDDQLYGSVMQGQGTPNVEVLWNNSTGVTANLICRIRKCFGTFKNDTLKVYVLPAPTAVITGPSPVCDGAPFSISVTGNGTSVQWDMGDGNVLIGGSTFNYAYDLKNVTTVSRRIVATVFNPNGCPDTISASKSINVAPGPVSRINPNGRTTYICDSNVGQNLTVTQLIPASITGYQWYRNGVPVGTGSSYYASQFGTYHVTLTSSSGCVYTTEILTINYECEDTCDLSIHPTVTIDAVTQDSCGLYHITASHSATGFISHRWVTGGSIVSSNVNEAYVRFGTANSRHSVTYFGKYTDGTDTCEYEARVSIDVPYIADLGVTQLCTGSGGNRDILISFKGSQSVPITSYLYRIDGGSWISGGSSYSTGVTPGSHYFEIAVGTGTTCWAGKTVVIEPLPIADFTFWRSVTCAQQAAVEFTNQSTPTIYKSFWDFGDGATNYQQHPERVYLTGGIPPKNVTLTITDANGCSDNVTKVVPIIDPRLEGSISTSPYSPCKGQPVSLTYIPNNPNFPAIPDTFHWMNDDLNFAIGTFNPMTVFESGYYWVQGTDTFGCYYNTIADTVNIVEVPPAFVYGDTNQCRDENFILSGYAGSDPKIQYSWLMNGFPISGSNALLQQKHSIPGVYTYRVIITVPNPGGGTCSDTSDPFRVRVRALPAAPTIAFSITDCNDYTVELQASPALSHGTYNWSTGQSGTPVTVKTGGNFQLTYTDTFGCQSDTSVEVPKDPRVYLWIFPTGCFKICPPEVWTLTGPVIRFNQWQYLRGFTVHGGSNSVPTDYTNLFQDGVYNLFLNNGWCFAFSDDMVVEENCESKPGRPSSTMLLQHRDVKLELSPNPTSDRVTVLYAFNASSESRWIEVYDVTGRLVTKHQAPSADGEWQLKLDQLSPGIYNVMMREDGNGILYGKLSVVR